MNQSGSKPNRLKKAFTGFFCQGPFEDPPHYRPRLGRVAILGGLCLLALLGAGAWWDSAQTAAAPAVSTQFIMDTFVEQRLYGRQAQEAAARINDALREFEEEFSAHREDSVVAQINRAAGQEPVEVSQRAFDLLSRSRRYGEESGGLFDVTIAPVTSE
ncbi:MAG: FAD:protein FMN transferase [Oscillospiraceae bacterium]|nr:FAD:protein FMN transferase [Oscillospiraceae bacterium]